MDNFYDPNDGFQNNGYPNNGYPNNGYPNNGYAPAPPPQNNNQTMKIVTIIVAATVIIAVGMVTFLLIYFNGRDKPDDDPTNAPGTTETVVVDEMFDMPDLTGLNEQTAVERLRELGLSSEIRTEETDKEREGNVIDHSPKAGSRVREGDEVTLYIAKAKPTEKPTEKPTAAPKSSTTSVTYLYCTAADYVSLRSGPGVSYTEYVRIPSRDGMIYLGEKSGNWYKVRYGDYTGYVSANYVSFDKNAATNYTPDGGSSSSSNRSPKTYSGEYLYCTASDFVSLRTGPGVNNRELARIPHGYSMKYMGYKSGNWYYVKYGSQYGYVSASYVTFDPDAV